MNIIKKGLELKGAPAEIPNCGRDDLPKFFKEMGYTHGVEIGVYKGEYTEHFAKEGLFITGVDTWKPYKDFDIMVENRIKRQNFLYKSAKTRLSKYDNVNLFRGSSMEAINNFDDESLDFVYIDGNHKFKYVAEDICEWAKKVKKGGCISGHDYIHPSRMRDRWDNLQVKFVVDAYMEAFRIDNWYVLGEKKEKPGEKRDRFRSWFFIKK